MNEKNHRITKLAVAEILGRNFTIYGTAENPLFLARDVAEMIEYSKRSNGTYKTDVMLSSIDEDEKIKIPFVQNSPQKKGAEKVGTLKSGGVQETWFLTEDGFYEVLMQSRKPVAKHFKKAVKKLLHDIRVGQAAVKYCDPVESAKRYIEAETARRALAEKFEAAQPKIEFADALRESGQTITVGELASILSKNGYRTGQNRLFSQLRAEGFLIRYGERRNQPTQTAIEMGVMESRESVVKLDDGETIVAFQPRITPKGQQYFLKRYAEDSDDEKQTA